MNDYILSFRGVIKKKDGILFFENNLQALCKWDYLTNEISVVCGCEDIEYFTGFEIFENNDDVIVVSTYGQRILIYNCKENRIREIVGDNICDSKEVISQCVLLNHKIYMIFQKPSSIPIVIFDIDTYLFSTSNILLEKIINYNIWAPFTFATSNGFIGMEYGNNRLFEVDIKNDFARVFSLQNVKELLCAGQYKEQVLTCSLNSYDLYFENEGSKSIVPQKDICKEAYSYIIRLEDYLVVLPRFGNRVIIFSEKKEIVVDIESYVEMNNKSGSFATSCFQIDKYVILCPTNKNGMLKIDVDEGKYEIVCPTITKSCIHRRLMVSGIEYEGIIYEKKFDASIDAVTFFIEQIV